jgi:hypothetical protein
LDVLRAPLPSFISLSKKRSIGTCLASIIGREWCLNPAQWLACLAGGVYWILTHWRLVVPHAHRQPLNALMAHLHYWWANPVSPQT